MTSEKKEFMMIQEYEFLRLLFNSSDEEDWDSSEYISGLFNIPPHKILRRRIKDIATLWFKEEIDCPKLFNLDSGDEFEQPSQLKSEICWDSLLASMTIRVYCSTPC